MSRGIRAMPGRAAVSTGRKVRGTGTAFAVAPAGESRAIGYSSRMAAVTCAMRFAGISCML
jgi:hypothetical protein